MLEYNTSTDGYSVRPFVALSLNHCSQFDIKATKSNVLYSYFNTLSSIRRSAQNPYLFQSHTHLFSFIWFIHSFTCTYSMLWGLSWFILRCHLLYFFSPPKTVGHRTHSTLRFLSHSAFVLLFFWRGRLIWFKWNWNNLRG